MKKIAILLLMVFLTGCAVSNKVWKYTAEPPTYKETEVKARLQVNKFNDLRENDNEIMSGGKFFLAMVPLVPYTTVSDLKVPEGLLPKAPDIFAEATGEEIRNAGIFEDVIILPPSQKNNADYLLEGTILSTNVRQTISFYGLSLPGDLLWLFGAPPGKAYNNISIKFRLINKKYEILFEKVYNREKDWWLSYYSNQGLNFYEELYKSINMELLHDLREVLYHERNKIKS